MPRLIKGIHCYRSTNPSDGVWCGGSVLWDERVMEAVSGDEFEKLLENGGRKRLHRNKYKRKNKRIVTDPVCGRCRIGYLASKKPRPRKKARKREYVGEVVAVMEQKQVGQQLAAPTVANGPAVAMPKTRAIPDPVVGRY